MFHKNSNLHLLAALLLVICSIIAVYCIDKPLTLLIHYLGFDQWLGLRIISEYLAWILASVTLLVIVNKYVKTKRLMLAAIIYVAFSVYLTMLVKTGLKIMFGRYWPNTWLNDNLSLLKNAVYAFDWWYGSANQGSFPSGHTIFISFLCLWLIYLQPRLRYLCLFCIALIITSLVLLNYHFIGDCLAGLALAYLMAIISIGVGYRYYKKLLRKS